MVNVQKYPLNVEKNKYIKESLQIYQYGLLQKILNLLKNFLSVSIKGKTKLDRKLII